jgi:hypothetical protein
MRSAKIGLASILIMGILFATFLVNGTGYSNENSIPDPSGDFIGYGDFADIVKVWVDNNESFIMFKVETVGPWNLTMPDTSKIDVFISVDNTTGSDEGGMFTNFLADYIVEFVLTAGIFHVGFYDYANWSGNSLIQGDLLGMGFFNISTDGRTVEFGWKLNTTAGGKGNLILSLGQQIYLKCSTQFDSDFAPDIGLEPMAYILVKPISDGGIPAFELLFATLSLITLVVLHRFLDKKPNP